MLTCVLTILLPRSYLGQSLSEGVVPVPNNMISLMVSQCGRKAQPSKEEEGADIERRWTASRS